MSHPKDYAKRKNCGWNWIVNGGSSLAAATCDRQPNWAIGTNPADVEKNKKKLGINKKESVAFSSNAPGHVPGYTGYIRGANCVSGVRFGVKTRLACTKSVEELMCDTTIPPKVHGAIPKYAIDPKNVSSKLELEPRRIPGYMGYVAGTRNEFGDTFGRTTATALKNGYEYEGYRSAVDQLEQRRKTAAGLGVDKEGMFYENAMTLSRD